MYYYIRINKEGKILRTYVEEREIKNHISMGLIKVTKDIIEAWKQHPNWIYNDGQLVEPKKTDLTLNEMKKIKLLEIKDKFTNEVKYGVITFTIPSSGITVQVDARRNSANNDLQNVEGLIEMIQTGTIIPPIYYKCYDNQKYTMGLNDLIALKHALMQRGLLLYTKKHYLEDLVEQAQTKEELDQIKW